MRKIFKVTGVDCAHCAGKMEKKINKIDGVENATLNFLTQKLSLDIDENNLEEIKQCITKTCKKIDSDFEIVL